MYVGTKIGFHASLLPNGFSIAEIDSFSDYKNKEKKVIEIERSKVIDKVESNTLNNIINYVDDELKTDKLKAFGVIKFIDSNIKGNNTLKDVKPLILVTVEIFSKPLVKPKKVSSNKDKAK